MPDLKPDYTIFFVFTGIGGLFVLLLIAFLIFRHLQSHCGTQHNGRNATYSPGDGITFG
ncbi:hypothetical protein RvY_01951 [Ramazzottius varieornatus]|uniref:Uncharacterized protein n=1 Tax=Ramazzottius varieornatus TaxID=947166 RepID=A0A1D1UI65_RAMVA|nr:hypothetical protein RvY_01951 [Ramazzottius varieornatus]